MIYLWCLGNEDLLFEICKGVSGCRNTRTTLLIHSGLVGFGLDRKTDENTLMVYLQKFSDDTLMKYLIPKLTDHELNRMFTTITKLLKNHLTEAEYHKLFLKDV